METVETLAREYVENVAARRKLGDSHPEYHSREPKIRAIKILLDRGMSASDAVKEFSRVCEGVNP